MKTPIQNDVIKILEMRSTIKSSLDSGPAIVISREVLGSLLDDWFTMHKRLTLIADIAYGYDGNNDVFGLKGLVDELRVIAIDGYDISEDK